MAIVYEGELRILTHKEILLLILEMVKLFIGVQDIKVFENKILGNNINSYQKYTYQLNIINPLVSAGKYYFKNISIIVKNSK